MIENALKHVDSALSSGWYEDTKVREWARHDNYAGVWYQPGLNPNWHTSTQMRRLIRTDQHREECPGLKECEKHPAPIVIATDGTFHVYAGDNSQHFPCRTLPDAMDKAIKLTEKDNTK